jgi:hypothetical protein
MNMPSNDEPAVPPQYVSFVIRLFVTHERRMVWGRLFRVPEQDGRYFRTWNELIVLLEESLSGSKDSQASTPPDQESA